MMNIRARTIFLAVLITGVQPTATMAQSSDADPYPTIALPVYSGAYDIEYSFNRLKGTKALRYNVQINYPAAEVLEFYDAALNARGWKPSFEICQRHWATLENDSRTENFRARQLFTSWEHPQYRLQISLRMKYQPPEAARPDAVAVQCRLQPQLDNAKQAQFFDSLKASGQYHAFTKKLMVYRRADGDVDPDLLARDIRNKKADENLIVYKQIMDEQKQAIEDIIQKMNKHNRVSP